MALWEVRDELGVRHELGHFYVIPRHFANGSCRSNKDSVSKQWLVRLSGSVQAQVLDALSCQHNGTPRRKDPPELRNSIWTSWSTKARTSHYCGHYGVDKRKFVNPRCLSLPLDVNAWRESHPQ